MFFKLTSFAADKKFKSNKITKNKQKLEISQVSDGRFRGNILVVGKTASGKTYFLQKLRLNKFFGKLVKTEWVTGIGSDEQREAEIK